MSAHKCDQCGELAPFSEGVASISTAIYALQEASERRRMESAWTRLSDVPAALEWRWTHVRCEGSEVAFDFAGERLSSEPRILALTLSLMERRWIGLTDWEGLVRRFFPDLPHIVS